MDSPAVSEEWDEAMAEGGRCGLSPFKMFSIVHRYRPYCKQPRLDEFNSALEPL